MHAGPPACAAGTGSRSRRCRPGAGAQALPSLVGTPLLSAPEAAAALVRGLVATRGLVVRRARVARGGRPGVRADLRRDRALRASLHRVRALRARVPDRRPQDDYFERSMKGKHRGVMRRRWKKLDAQLGGEPQVVDVTGDSAAVEELIEIEGASQPRRGRDGAASRTPPTSSSFARCAPASRPPAGSSCTPCDTETRRSRSGATCSPTRGSSTSRSPTTRRFAQFSPGIRLEVESFHLFHDRAQSEWVDSCSDPNNETMNRLLPERRALVTLVLVKPGVRAALTAGCAPGRAASARARHGGVAGNHPTLDWLGPRRSSSVG